MRFFLDFSYEMFSNETWVSCCHHYQARIFGGPPGADGGCVQAISKPRPAKFAAAVF